MKNILTIFGGSGNLAYLKLYPALLSLDEQDQLPDNFQIIAAARSKRRTEEFRLEVKKRLKLIESDPIVLEKFLKRINYISLSFSDLEDYNRLKEKINALDEEYSIENNRIFYLATSPDFFSIITKNLSDQDMISQAKGNQKIVIEKPFGTDYESAKELNDHLLEYIHEEDIYRIDHYLGKDMIANILYLRFSNPIFSGVWNKEYIDNIQIVASEEIGIEDRGRYYDDSGALRDMVQNHLLQILGTVAMEMPEDFDTHCVQKEKIKIFKALRVYNCDEVSEHLALGQYKENTEKDLKGYHDEKGIKDDSLTETFAALEVFIDHPTWEGVPFFLKTGKRLEEKAVYITIEFKKDKKAEHMINKKFQSNVLQIKIQPEEGINVQFNLKKPRVEDEISSVEMDFCKSCLVDYLAPDAYEKILSGLFKNEKLLFTTWEELKYTWHFIDPIAKSCSDTKKGLLSLYTAGTKGPDSSDELVKKTGRHWWPYE